MPYGHDIDFGEFAFEGSPQCRQVQVAVDSAELLAGITWNYALMLARIPGVKADRMVIRYVADAIGKKQDPPAPKEASVLVK